jgi:tRNA modification GTPase
VSGDSAADALKLVKPEPYDDTEITPNDVKVRHRYAHYRKFYNIFNDNPKSNILDEGLLLYFKDPHSFTGEDMIEF